jgi:hypothetical protein
MGKHGHHAGRLRLLLVGGEGMCMGCPSLTSLGREGERGRGGVMAEGSCYGGGFTIRTAVPDEEEERGVSTAITESMGGR